jgi:hypothetical protein
MSRRSATPREVKIEDAEIRSLLGAGVNRTDIGRQPIPELGFRIDAWGGESDECYGLSIQCGIYSKLFPNLCLLTLPPTGEYSFERNPDWAQKAFEGLISIWSPDQAAIWRGDDLEWNARKQFASNMRCIRRYSARAA